MKLLLDTHVLLWLIERPDQLSKRARTALLNEDNELVASVASMWEINLKVQASKLKLSMGLGYLEDHFRRAGVSRYLPVDLFHVQRLSALPAIHKDPFDRLLVAQCMAEGMTLVSKDETIRQYPLTVLW